MIKTCCAFCIMIAILTGCAKKKPLPPPPNPAIALADRVIKASGGEKWEYVRRVQFTIHIEEVGKPTILATHDWDVIGKTDTATWDGKTVRVDLANQPVGGDELLAYQRWTHDTYWLLAPLKILDPGIVPTYFGQQEVDGESFDILHLAFGAASVAPGNQFNLYIDPETHLIRYWEFMPGPEMKARFTFDNYLRIGGLYLSLERNSHSRQVYFTDVKILWN